MKNESKSLDYLILEIPELEKHYPHFRDLFHTNNRLDSKDVLNIFLQLIDSINAARARQGSQSASFNFYPSDKSTDCKEFCLCIATDKFGWKYRKEKCRTGFKGLMKELVGYWINCGSVNKKTVIITLDWDDKEFDKDWKQIINSYVVSGKTVEIFEVIESQGEFIKRFPGR